MTLSKADIDLLFGPEPADSVESLLDAPVTGEDISLAMQDPAFTPTQTDYLKYEEYAKNKQTDWINTISQSVDAAANMIGGAISEGAQGAVINPLNYIEGAAQGTRQLYGLVAQSQDPGSPLFKFKDLVAGSGTAQSRYEQFLEARDFANRSARLESGQDFLAIQPEFTNPEFVQGVSMILDPTLALPGIGEILGAGKLATRAVGKGAQLTGRAVAGVARPLERFAGAAERMTAEALGMAPEALRSTAATAGLAGALGIAPEAAAFAAIPAGIRTAREAGEALARAGENLMTQPSRIGPLEAIGAAPGANMRQRMLGVIGQYGGDAAVDASLRGLAGGIEGAAIGTLLGGLSGGEEGAAAGLGSGGVQGAAGALGARGYQKLTGAAAKEARAGDLGRFIDGQQDPTTKALFERVRDTHGVDAASALMDLQGLVRGKFGDVDILYRSNAEMAEKFGDKIRGVQIELGERPTIFINADILGKGTGDGPLYTLGHELFHALEKTTQLEGGATEIKDSLVGRWAQEGDVVRKLAEGAFNDAEIEARFNQYRDKLAAGSQERADQLAQYDTIDKKAGYVASELAAEHFAGLLAGQKPDALLKGFTGITRQLLDSALTQNASRALADAAATIERTFGVKPTDSVLFPDLKQASPQVNAMLRDLLRARRKLDERITIENEGPGKVLKPQDVSNPIAAKQLVDLGVAEKMPDGSVRNLSDEEIRVREEKDTTAIRTILEGVPGARVVDGEILGRFSPQQLSAIEQSQAVSSRMKDKIRAVNAAMDAGNSIFVNYGAATRRVKNRLTGKFTSKYNSGIRLSQREVLPYSFYLSKADNPVIKAIDISKIRGALDKLTAPDGSVAKGLWDNVDGFMGDLAGYFTNLDAGEGARRSAEIFGLEKAKYLGDFVNEQEKGGRKFVRDFRLDRIGSTTPMDFRARISEDAIQKSKMRWMPAEKLGDKSIINSEEGYRIISGAKHKLYSPDGKLIGIYDTQTQAERKADATQTRLQPEVRQQQRPLGDEGRQATEAGGRNRIERGQEGQGEGGAVRQAGDVRFMPDGTSDGLAVLDDVLKLELPRRPKVIDIANAFQNMFGKAIEYRKSNPQDNARLVNLLVQEIDRAVKLHPEAKGWYDENVKLTMDVMRDLDPDLAKPENDFIFKAILAATSDGNKVGPQFQQTWKEYSNWKNTGEISGEFVSGDRIDNIQTNLEMLNEFIKDIGWEKTKDFMVQKGTVKDLRQALVDVFGWTKKQANSIGSSERVDEVVPFAVVLGPKLGSFFNNLYGDFSSVTMDRWFMRTLGRLTGTQVAPLTKAKLREMRNNLRDAVARLTPSEFEMLGVKRGDLKGTSIDGTATTIAGRFSKKALRETAKQSSEAGQSALEETRKFANALKKGLNPLVEAPVDGTHRRWIRERIAEVQSELRSRGIELENADLQAVLWYLEKELYEKLNYRSKSGESDYASAASSLYQTVAGRPSDVYAGGTGRVRAIGSTGGSEGMGAGQASQAPGPEVAGEQRFMPADENTGLPLNPDKTVTVYHHTNKTAAEAIRRTGVLKSAGEPDVYVTTEKSPTTGYGDEVVAINVDPKKLQIDDQFPDGRTDFRMSVGKPGGSMKVKVDAGVSFMPAGDREVTRAVNINDFSQDFTGQILNGQKTIETRDTLNNAMQGVLGQRIGLVRTGIKDTKVVGYATVAKQPIVYRNEAEFRRDEERHLVAPGSPYDIKKGGVKYGYELTDVVPVEPFAPKSVGRMYSVIEPKRYMPETIQRDVGRNQDFANPPTETEAVDALSSEKKAKFGAARSIKPGTQVAARIDIPAFLRTGKYVVAVHEPDGAAGGPGKVIGYDTVTRLQNPKFVVKPGVQRIYEGKSAKFPVATVDGKIMADRSIPDDLENYVAVGMDPKEHAFFYDKRTDQPVIGGSEAVSVGNTVFVKNPVYGKPEDFRYMPSPDSAMPGAYSFPGGYRAIPGKAKGSLRLYGPAGSLIGIASSLDEAQRIIRKKSKQ